MQQVLPEIYHRQKGDFQVSKIARGAVGRGGFISQHDLLYSISLRMLNGRYQYTLKYSWLMNNSVFCIYLEGPLRERQNSTIHKYGNFIIGYNSFDILITMVTILPLGVKVLFVSSRSGPSNVCGQPI